MAEFDPEKFEDKYAHYFTELQRAYRNAFDRMNEAVDSQLVHAIDQQVLDESEPVYEDGAFGVELPEDPFDRLEGVAVDRSRFEETLERYVSEIEDELERVFDYPDADE